jgi:hypothetical protein
MGIAELEPHQLAPTVGKTGAGSTGSPVPSTLQEIRRQDLRHHRHESSIKIFDAAIDRIFEFAIMTFKSADMVFDAAIDKKFDLFIDKKFDLFIDKKFDLFIDKKFYLFIDKKFDLYIDKKFDLYIVKKFDLRIIMIFDLCISRNSTLHHKEIQPCVMKKFDPAS